MIKSMTAFGRGKAVGERRDITVEIKSVNSRYLDCNVRLPRSYIALEEPIKSYLKTVISRGKVEVFVTVEEKAAAPTFTVDLAYARAYAEALRTLRDELGLKDDIGVMSVARENGVFQMAAAEEDEEANRAQLTEALQAAAAEFIAMREAEGARLAADFREKLEGIGQHKEAISALSAADVTGYRAKLEARLRGLLGENGIAVDENRLLTECAIFADRVAIDEELVRLESHFGAFRAILEEREPVGRKLDFLMQEMNREINTIGSKCQNVAITTHVVDVKNELEKIREQVQNVE